MKPELPGQIGYSALTSRERVFLDVIEDLRSRVEKADRLAEAVDNTLGLWPGGDEEAHALTAALSEYREETNG